MRSLWGCGALTTHPEYTSLHYHPWNEMSCVLTQNFLFCLGEEEEQYLLETNWDLEVDNFDDMGLKEEVLRGIYAFGFKEPSPI